MAVAVSDDIYKENFLASCAYYATLMFKSGVYFLISTAVIFGITYPLTTFLHFPVTPTFTFAALLIILIEYRIAPRIENPPPINIEKNPERFAEP